jgi:tripartite-type tricarboxylate transporter receptor subunit TctC
MGHRCGFIDTASGVRSGGRDPEGTTTIPPRRCRSRPAGERVFRLTALLSLLCLAVGAVAQPYPAKPVRIVIPFPPGGGTDSIVRAFSTRFAEVLGQSLVLDNRSGANGNVGTELVAKSPPDGYALLKNGSGTLAINPSLYSRLPYDPLRDFAPIGLSVLQPHVLTVHPSIPVRSVADLVRLAKSQPGKLNFASSGSGSLAHLGGELFKAAAVIDVVHVPYKGAAPALVDLLGGQVHMVFASSPAVMPHVKSKRLRALAVTTNNRIAVMPEVPTVIESGLTDFVLIGWYGLLAPAGTPASIVNRLSADLAKTLRFADVRERLNGLGLEIESSTPEEFGRFMAAEIEKYAKVVRSANIRID